jgi:hypothetical protein
MRANSNLKLGVKYAFMSAYQLGAQIACGYLTESS